MGERMGSRPCLCVAFWLAGCGASTICGPGTQRKQLPNGDAACVAVSVAKGDTECDADGGVQLVAGNRCVSQVQCGPGTVLDPGSQKCLPTGQQMAHEPPVCTPPTAGHICVNGTLRNFPDGSFLSAQTVRVTIYDPQTFFGNPNPPSLADGQSSDTFMFPGIPTPSSKYLLVVTRDPMGATAMYQGTGIGGAAVDGQSVRVDGYVITRALLTSWSTMAGTDFDTAGALVYRFFNDPPPPSNARTPTETHPVAGVQVIDGNINDVAAGVKYFAPSLMTIDGALTATSSSGGAILTATGVSTFTGRGGGVTTWEAHAALAIPHIVQIDFLHPQS
jgi:hypothetical protein